MSNIGLSVNDVVNVSVVLAPVAAQTRNFGALLILGDSNVIDTQQRLRAYTSITGITADFGTSAPEYLAAVEFFGQTPQPSTCYVGRWARTATPGTLTGATLGTAAQNIANFSGITNGGIQLTINGTLYNLSSLNLTGVTNLNGVAAIVQTALGGAGTVYWDANNSRFVVKSTSTGTGSTVALAVAGSGTDLSVPMGLSASSSGAYSVAGILAETPASAVATFLSISNAWYGLMFSASTQPQDSDYVAVSALIQAASPSRVFGITTQEGAALTGAAGSQTSIANTLAANRTACQYSSSSAVAFAAAFGNAFSTNFQGQNTLYTLKFKQESGITAETLTESQSAQLTQSNCNAFVNYDNGVAILQQGVMTDGTFFDVIHGTDWLQNDLQVAVVNYLLTARKVPQTDAGVNQLVSVIAGELNQAVVNGLVAPGVWTGPPIGNIATGQTLTLGYYIYAPPISTQSYAARLARQSPVLIVCIKLAGAIHSANIVVNVNQ